MCTQVVELTRKLILTGLIGLVGRGSVAQAVAGLGISFYFFAISTRYQPFVKPTLNKIKAFSEVQIFAILGISVVIQTANVGADFDSEEAVTIDHYGQMLVVLAVAFLPITVYFVISGFCDAKEQLSEGDNAEEKEFENPVAE